MAGNRIRNCTLTHRGQSMQFVLEHKAVKNLNLRVRRDGTVHLSVPLHVTKARAEQFLIEKWSFLMQAKARIAARALPRALTLADGEEITILGILHTVCLQSAKRASAACREGVLYLALPHPEDAAARIRLFWRFASGEVERMMRELTAKAAPYFLPEGAPLPEITLRRMKGRWGSCYYTRNRINYNTNLIFAPQACAYYVACHELAHFRHPDHSAAFYACLSRVLPQHKDLRRVLHSIPIPELEAN